MISEFTEFSYGFAVTYELVLENSGSVFAAPEFPSLIREGQVGGGYDVRLDFGNFLFLQFKLSEFMRGGLSGQSNVIGLPYYRFWITPRRQSQQHRLLVDLQNTGQQIYYAAPIFHRQAVFNTEFQARTVVNRSAFFTPSEIGNLEDDESHCVVFNDTQAYFCSEPKQLRLHTGISMKQFLGSRMQAVKAASTVELALRLRNLVGAVTDQVPVLSESSVSEALTFISFVAHVFFHCEVFFVPAL